MGLLILYTFKNIFARKLTSALTVFGIALVVFVFASVLMLSNGLSQAMVDTGYADNVIVIRAASQTEVQSILYRESAQIIKADPAIAKDASGNELFTNEILVLISQPKRDTDEPSNVPVRGATNTSTELRPNLKITEGRMYRPGTSEIIAGQKVAENFKGCGLGEKVRFGLRDWTVVGIFESGGSGFESELWGDVDQFMDAFRRPVYSSLTFKLANPDVFDEVKARLEGDRRLPVEVMREKDYYASQSKFTTTFINVLGIAISIIFSLGAIVGAMITMYASVANRTTEIGTLRALGFQRRTILWSFLLESLMISLFGGALGIGAAFLMNFKEVSTTNWNTFAELAFGFQISPLIIVQALAFAVVMGFVGGFLPAVRASRLKIINALRAR
jgi:ABC-type lipoprotein release transport system permease subunit